MKYMQLSLMGLVAFGLGWYCKPPTYAAGHLSEGCAIIKQIAWKDGFTAAFIDNVTIENFHHCADALPNDDDPVALEACWEKQIVAAHQTEDSWNTLTIRQKLNYPIEEFWKSDKGEPRRLSRAQKDSFKKSLEGIK